MESVTSDLTGYAVGSAGKFFNNSFVFGAAFAQSLQEAQIDQQID